ncbi:MAG: hypothetical protein GKR89_12635 [Candidatus Latescibacteria bacterium]|nr:hypothetical protein [Candidatus Latescibacterota bacterium]
MHIRKTTVLIWGGILLGILSSAGQAEDEFARFEQTEQKAFARFEEMDRGVRRVWEHRQEQLARSWAQEYAQLLQAFGQIEAAAVADPLKTVSTQRPDSSEIVQSQIDFVANKVRVEVAVVAPTREQAQTQAEKLARQKMAETAQQVVVPQGEMPAAAVAQNLDQVYDETQKESAALADGQVKATVALERPLTGVNSLTAVALQAADPQASPGSGTPAPDKVVPQPADQTSSTVAAALPPVATPSSESDSTTAASPQTAPTNPSAKPTTAVSAQEPVVQPAQTGVPAAPAQQGPFTGLLLDATAQPGARPSLVPTVRTPGGDLVYGPATVQKEAAIHGMAVWLRAAPGPGDNDKLGAKPLRIAVEGVQRGGKLTISPASAAQIQAADDGFLAQCRVGVLLGR